MKALVTGAAGFVGRHLLEYLSAQPDTTCTGVTRTPSSSTDYILCELGDAAQVEAVIKKTQPSHIFHVAGSFTNDFETDYVSNVLSAINILEAALKHKKDCRIMLMGSAAEYGEVNQDDNPISEQHALNPISIYGWSKAAQSLLAPLYAKQHGLAVMVARTFNLLGTGMSEKLFVGHVERQIQDLRTGKTSRISVGNLDAQRDYIDINHACAMYLEIASKGQAGEIYNVGSGIAISMRSLLSSILKTHAIDESIVDVAPNSKPKTEISASYADISKLTALMNSDSAR